GGGGKIAIVSGGESAHYRQRLACRDLLQNVHRRQTRSAIGTFQGRQRHRLGGRAGSLQQRRGVIRIVNEAQRQTSRRERILWQIIRPRTTQRTSGRIKRGDRR